MQDKTERLRGDSLRGIDASQILENPAYQEAIKRLNEGIVSKWKECPIRDKEGQQLLLQMAKVANTFERLLSGMVETGRLADMELDRMRSDSKAKQIFRRVF